MIKRMVEMRGEPMNRILAAVLKEARTQGLPFDATAFVILTMNLPDNLGVDYAAIGHLPEQMIDQLPLVLRSMEKAGDSGTRQ